MFGDCYGIWIRVGFGYVSAQLNYPALCFSTVQLLPLLRITEDISGTWRVMIGGFQPQPRL
jgi:hypothetical protein